MFDTKLLIHLVTVLYGCWRQSNRETQAKGEAAAAAANSSPG